MFDDIRNMAKEAGRDPSAFEMIVTAGVEIHKGPPGGWQANLTHERLIVKRRDGRVSSNPYAASGTTLKRKEWVKYWITSAPDALKFDQKAGRKRRRPWRE